MGHICIKIQFTAESCPKAREKSGSSIQGSEQMSKKVNLPYNIAGLANMPNEPRLANISVQNTSKRWVMSTLQDYFLFTIEFKAPSTVYFADIRGNNTYKMDLAFLSPQKTFLCEYSLEFSSPTQSKIIQIREHPLAQYVDVKLLNNPQSRMKMGLGYVLFKGYCEFIDEINRNPNYKFGVDAKDVFNERQTFSKRKEIYIEPDSEMMVPQIPQTALQNQQITLTQPTQSYRPPLATQEIIIQEDEPKEPLPFQQIKITEDPPMQKPYITYDYNERGTWWNLLKFVRSEWVEGQKNIENERGVAEEDRMSAKIQVKHLWGKKVIVEGLDQERREIIERTCLDMGATLMSEVKDGYLVVTTREYGSKIANKKKFKNTKLVTEQYIFNCRKFNCLLNESDYGIH